MFIHRSIVFAAALLTILSSVQAQQIAPVNPATIKAIQNHSTQVPHSVLLTPSKANVHALAVYPNSFDLRTSGKSAPVRDQQYANSCWSFTAIASLEGTIRPSDTANLSEMHLGNRHGFDWAPGTGGNRAMATAYFTRWEGPVLESDDPFYDYNTVSPGTVPAYAHIQQAIWLPARTSSSDNADIKYCVTTYGPVAADIFWDELSYTESTSSIYTSVVYANNHEVSIIGWDDNYSRNNFQGASGTPAGDGAFLFKNSWGSSWGQSGYGWISYYDVNLGKSSSCYPKVQPVTNYQHIYQYDPLGWTRKVGYGQETAYLAAVYTAEATEQIVALGIVTPVANSSYQASIYLNPTTGPVAGAALATTTGTISYPGYHTITLSSPVSVTAGQKFSAVVKITTPGETYPIAYEGVVEGYCTQVTASLGQTYISYNGSSWSDMAGVDPNSNVCLKAFGKPAGSTRSVSGQITLSGFEGDSRYVEMQAQVKRTDVPGQTINMPLYRNSSGYYQINWLPAGTYSLRVSGSHFPAVTKSGINISAGSVSGQNLALPNGDADGNGQVNLFDFVMLDMHFGQEGLGLVMDLDGSGAINLFDYVVIDQNFGVQASNSL